MKLLLERRATPVSELLVVTDDTGALRALDFLAYETRLHRLLRRHYEDYELVPGKAPAEVRAALEAYFDGDLQALDTLRVATNGTAFQRAVWAKLRAIPAGETKTYGQIAKALGRPSACRAVGAANGSNPIAIVVPCHRVIGASGALTGYASGMKNKEWLLAHERRHARRGEARVENFALCS